MADTISYRKNAIVSYLDITVLKGVPYEDTKTFEFASIKSSYIRTDYKVSATGDDSLTYEATAYNDVFTISMYITYWDDEGVGAGISQCILMFPYNSYESDIMRNRIDVPIEDLYIKSIRTVLSYNGKKASATFSYVKLKPSMTTEEVVKDSYASSVTLRAVHTYTNGCKLFYDNDNVPLTLEFKGDAAGNLTAIDVLDTTDTPTRTITVTKFGTNIGG